MKIAILTSGILPVPAVQGGAVENLIDFYLEYNNKYKLHDITVYSIYDKCVEKHPALCSKVNNYKYIKTKSIYAKAEKLIRRFFYKKGVYHHVIEYYLDKVIKQISRQNFDVIILENRPHYTIKLSDLKYKKLIVHLHNEHLTKTSYMSKEIYNKVDRFICVSDYISNIVKSIGNKNDKVITVHNGINLDTFSQIDNSIVCRKALGLNRNDFVLIYSGRINKDKGISELIDALILLKEFSNIKLLILGSSFFGNTNSDDIFISKLKEKAKILNNNIIFTGFIPYRNVPSFLKIADVAVIPSIWNDPFPTTVLEAQAIGLPIITTNKGGIREEVSKENAIILNVDSNFKNKLSESILYLYNNQETRNNMGIASKKRALLFSKEEYAKNFFKALE